jgi:hypothetical protein
MTMFCDGRWTAMKCESGGGAFAHALRAATIAAVACSYISSASSDEYPPPPPIKILNTEAAAPFLKFLSEQEVRNVQNVQFVTIAYTDPDGEKLIVFKFGGSEADPSNVPFPVDKFLIPPDGQNFGDAACTYIFPGSSLKATTCSRSGGTRYCNF